VRRVTEPIELDVGTIPAGTLLNLPLVHMLRDPQRFPDPTAFVPDRWTERPRAGTVETAMFGGGPHFCLGYHIAMAEGILFNLVLARALREHGLRLVPYRAGPPPTPAFMPLVHAPANHKLRLVKASNGHV
jgi:cytochrome P450